MGLFMYQILFSACIRISIQGVGGHHQKIKIIFKIPGRPDATYLLDSENFEGPWLPSYAGPAIVFYIAFIYDI